MNDDAKKREFVKKYGRVSDQAIDLAIVKEMERERGGLVVEALRMLHEPLSDDVKLRNLFLLLRGEHRVLREVIIERYKLMDNI